MLGDPLHRFQPETYSPPQDQRHTALVAANVTIGKKRNWIVSLSYQFQSGSDTQNLSTRDQADSFDESSAFLAFTLHQ